MDVKKPSSYFVGILCFVGLYFIFGLLYALDKRDTNNVLYEIFRGKVLAADKADSPSRILLIGGSNVLWGVRSKIIEDETGVPTFNLSLIHEAYHPKAMRELTLSVVRPGDVVIYASVSFWNSRETDPQAAAELLRVAGLEKDESPGLDTLKRTLDRYWSPYPQKNTIISSLSNLYRRYIQHEPSVHMQDLNDRGDVATCRTPGAAGRNGYNAPADQDTLLQELQDFADALRMRGASLVLNMPPTLVLPEQKETWINGYSAPFKAMQSRFAMATPSLEVNIYEDASLFCDTGFHLGDAEAASRSHKLGQYLREHKIVQPFAGN
jgi:hypothetical protein